IRWRRNGSDLFDGPTGTGAVISGAATPALSISGVAPAEAGSYECAVQNSCGVVTSAAAALSVLAGGTGDGDGSGAADGDDIQAFISILLQGGSTSPTYCAYDMNADGSVSIADLPLFVVQLLS